MKKILLAALLCVLVISTNAYAQFYSFDSLGWVNQNYANSWDPSLKNGIARYSFYFDDPEVEVFGLQLQFESDIFDLTQFDTVTPSNDFHVVAPDGWTTTVDIRNSVLYWSLSGGSAINATSSPILLDVNYALAGANRYSYGNNIAAGDSNVWSWNEAQGENTPWSQKYDLIGKFTSGIYQGSYAVSGGSTSPVPEPSSMMLLGLGVLGLLGFRRKIS